MRPCVEVCRRHPPSCVFAYVDKTSYGMANSEVNACGLDPLDRCIAHGLYCVLAVLAVSQTLLVGLNCLPLVLRDRVFGVLRQSRSLRKLMTASKYILSSRSLNHFVSTLFYFCDWLLAWLILISFDNASDGNAVTSAAEMVPSFLAVCFMVRRQFNQLKNIFKKVLHPTGRFYKPRRVERSSILCIENIPSFFAQQSLICKGLKIMACTSLEKGDALAKTLGLARGNDRLVAIVFAVAELNKTRS